MHPKKTKDFEILRNELDAWRLNETKKIKGSTELSETVTIAEGTKMTGVNVIATTVKVMILIEGQLPQRRLPTLCTQVRSKLAVGNSKEAKTIRPALSLRENAIKMTRDPALPDNLMIVNAEKKALVSQTFALKASPMKLGARKIRLLSRLRLAECQRASTWVPALTTTALIATIPTADGWSTALSTSFVMDAAPAHLTVLKVWSWTSGMPKTLKRTITSVSSTTLPILSDQVEQPEEAFPTHFLYLESKKFA